MANLPARVAVRVLDNDASDNAGQRVRQEDGGSKDGDEFERVFGATSDSLPVGIVFCLRFYPPFLISDEPRPRRVAGRLA